MAISTSTDELQQHLLFQQDGTPNSRKSGVDMGDQLLGDCNCQIELFSLGLPYRLYKYQPPLSATLQENYNNKSPVLAVQLVDGNAQHSVDNFSGGSNLHMLFTVNMCKLQYNCK
jgi:hypothetical protein